VNVEKKAKMGRGKEFFLDWGEKKNTGGLPVKEGTKERARVEGSGRMRGNGGGKEWQTCVGGVGSVEN